MRSIFVLTLTVLIGLSPGLVAHADTDFYCAQFETEAARTSWQQTTVDGEVDSFAPELAELSVNSDGTLRIMFQDARGQGYILTMDAIQ